MAKVERNASLKNERSLGENCENIILQEIKQTEWKSTKKQKVAKRRRIKRLICVRKVPYDDSHSTLGHFCMKLNKQIGKTEKRK